MSQDFFSFFFIFLRFPISYSVTCGSKCFPSAFLPFTYPILFKMFPSGWNHFPPTRTHRRIVFSVMQPFSNFRNHYFCKNFLFIVLATGRTEVTSMYSASVPYIFVNVPFSSRESYLPPIK